MLQFSELLGFSSLKSWKVGTAMNDWCDPFPSSVTLITRFEDGLGFKSLRWFAKWFQKPYPVRQPSFALTQQAYRRAFIVHHYSCEDNHLVWFWNSQQGQSLAVLNWQEGWCDGVIELCFLRGLGSEFHGKLRLSFQFQNWSWDAKVTRG